MAEVVVAEIETFDCLIVGGGKGGKTLGIELGKRGIRTAVVERDAAMVGGSCINVACIPTKTFVQSAKVVHQARDAARYGISVPTAEVLWPEVQRRVADVVLSMRAMNEKNLTTTPNLSFLLGSARLLDSRTVEVESPAGETRRLAAEKIFLNTGTRPAAIRIEGLSPERILNSNQIQRIDAVPRHLVVIGGGYIALEFAQLFRRLGSEVTVLVRGEQILPREDPDVAAAVREMLLGEGLAIELKTSVLRGDSTGETLRLQVTGPNGEREILADRLLEAVGRSPNTEGLGLEAAGVATDGRGFIRVNERLETSVPGIWALGDCNGGPQFTHVSLDDYRIVLANVFEGKSRTTSDRLVPSTLFTDPELAHVGLNETEAKRRGIEVRVLKVPIAAIPRARTTGRTEGFMKAILDPSSERILGCTIFGAEAGEMIAAVQVAMLAGLSPRTLRDTIFSHPTWTEGLNNLFAGV